MLSFPSFAARGAPVSSGGGAWGVRLATLVLWAFAAASVAYWGLRLAGRPQDAALPAVATAAAAPDVQAIARLFGAGAAPVAAAVPQPSLASRFKLVGVLAGQQSGGGAALIAVDGKPPKPYRVGAQVEDGLVLLPLGQREARLGPPEGPAAFTLELPRKP
ncbi:type II secretion system protein N [Extensimonas sp. H3M7-6]|uniref:type II secretion system protein N n=1 Tax=Extensimonas soli TaxID=3031322 RepID=UPI0023DCD463|nr:type II secretion system protein N [Extensimonas sp. H3M7-6]MDF1480566.1 type II secretion system protein N [Extensimonas sp. H3M7-6]